MKGKHVAITGPTAGIGRFTALELASRGAELTLFCRNREKGKYLRGDIIAAGGKSPRIIIMDMSSLDSVRKAAATFLDSAQPLDVLLNNAGVVNSSRKESADGFEESLAVNHLAPFLLTGMLLPALQASSNARIVNVASHAHRFVSDMGFEDMQAENGYRTFREYGRSKGANILFTRSLARRLQGSGITVNCLHPGAVATSLGTNNDGLVARLLPALLRPFFRTPEQGAATSLHLCCEASVADISGAYFSNCKQVEPKAWTRDESTAQQLWDYSQQCTDFDYAAHAPLSADR